MGSVAGEVGVVDGEFGVVVLVGVAVVAGPMDEQGHEDQHVGISLNAQAMLPSVFWSAGGLVCQAVAGWPSGSAGIGRAARSIA